jgi:GntR family transcriptional regulator/MocR family aminotransferase
MPRQPGPVVGIEVVRGGGGPLHAQVESGLRELVRSGALPPGASLPSSRELAVSLGVSRGVVVEAYAQLVAEGYLSASQGASTRVALSGGVERPPLPATSLAPRVLYDFDPGRPDLTAFPRGLWLKRMRGVLRSAPFDRLGGGDPRGTAELRDALMGYLGRACGAAPEPEHTLICSGFVQGLALVYRTLADRGVERVAVEEPGWAQHRLAAERCGLEPVPIPVDDAGLDVSELRSRGCEVIVTTPAHQFPTGVVLGSERRAALLEWAEEVDGLIIEDDYDSELRYDRGGVGALQGLAPERVCYIGSLSKRLAPALELGWILAPSWLSGALSFEQALTGGGVPALDQLTVAELIVAGDLDRHLRRMRLRYRERRGALIDALAAALPGATARGTPAGVFVLVNLPAGAEESAAVAAAEQRRAAVEGLAMHSTGPPAQPGLVLGFGNLPPAGARAAVRVLADAVREAM